MFTDDQIQTGKWVRKISADSYRGWRAFYHTKKWRQKRKDILKRDKNSCQACRKKGKYSRASTVHHIKHLKDMPELALDDGNLLSLCRPCHEDMHPERHKKRLEFRNTERW